MSINKITYLETIFPNNLFILINPYVNRLYFNDYLEIKEFLNELEQDKTYVLTFELIVSWLLYEEDSPVITLSKPILVTRNSNPKLIDNFIKDRVKTACFNYYLDDVVLEAITIREQEWKDKPGVLIKYKEINLF